MQNNNTTRKKRIINYADVSAELMEIIRKKYPLGWINNTIKVPTASGDFFYAITAEDDEFSYLIKVPVKIDTKSEKDEDFFESSLDMKDSEEKEETEEAETSFEKEDN